MPTNPRHLPRLRLPTSFHPEYFDPQGYHLVSRRLFELLDQPRGSLQDLSTWIEWLEGDPPDRTYLWLSCIPRHPALDLKRSIGEVEEFGKDAKETPIVQLYYPEIIYLREDPTSPYEVFRAGASRVTVFVIDAVAEAVVRAGCTGIAFVKVHASRAVEGPRRRRGVDGAAPHPRRFR
jgi:hypothetical protein